MNIPNLLTLSRIILIPIFVYFLLLNVPYGDYLAGLVFAIAALTDSLDGYLARRWEQVTKFGMVVDPLADKLLVTAALISLVELNRIAGWIAIIIIGREFAVTGLRIIKAEEGVIIPASSLGKLKTITQIIALLLVIVPGIYRPYVAVDLGMWCMYIAVVITVVSGIDYFYQSYKTSRT
ncbi:MAG TPA: CDP-diacylglycerol--glycerol-3-phosphate 3-phosphatidyltransferase [Syntrophomonadaceae bacterium]|nr:CDP-diacylglycerol--glycerol-3-phosphate 3-phosphatidyltransferase [Syntrophomonadaceae bacterium]